MEKIEEESIKERKVDKNKNKKNEIQHKEEEKDKIKDKSKKSTLSFNELKIIILSLISFYFYILSFKGCEGTQSYCLVTLSPGFFYSLGVYLIISVIITIYIFYQILNKNNSKYHLFYYLPILIYFLYLHDNGSDLSHHGSYNKMLFYVLFVIFIIVFLNFSLLKYIYKNYRIIFVSITLSFIWIIIYTNIKIKKNCITWYDGYNGLRVENDPKYDKCKIAHPKRCWINLLDGIFDVSRILRENCSNFRGGEKAELLKYLTPDFNQSNYFGYPITTNYTWLDQSHFDRFFNNVMADMINLDKVKYDQIDDELKPEILLKFDPISQMGDVSIKINKKEKMAKERNKLYNSLLPKDKPKYSNILFLYIDAISRPEFVRSMKQTEKFLSKYYNSTEKSLYQMMKYQNFIFFTQQNVNPMFFGESMFNSNGTSILKHIKKKGYITAHANNICTRQLYDIEDNYTENIIYDNFDHENIAFMCDPNFYNPENRFTPYMGPYSIRRRCLYGRDTFEYILEYGEKFWETYINEHKFLRLSFQDAHEGTLEVVKYLDVKLAEFLENFDKKGYLKDTAIFFVSDHGNNMIGFYNILQAEDYVLEKTLGTWFMLLPKKKNIDETYLEKNQQKMVSPYDIHDTLIDMFGYHKKDNVYSRKGKSVYQEINGLERDCNYYSQDIITVWCRCFDF